MSSRQVPTAGYPGKRALDLLLAVPGLVALAPVIAIAAVLIRLESRGRPLFGQERVGRDGVPFRCFKLRTMYAETEDMPSHLTPPSAVTPLGRRLRRLKLDELPQLWNVIRGEMSLVGPRPSLPTQAMLIDARRELGVLAARPGITGLAQVEGLDMSTPAALAKRDAEYLASVSLGTDLRLIAATFLGAGRGDAVKDEPPPPA